MSPSGGLLPGPGSAPPSQGKTRRPLLLALAILAMLAVGAGAIVAAIVLSGGGEPTRKKPTAQSAAPTEPAPAEPVPTGAGAPASPGTTQSPAPGQAPAPSQSPGLQAPPPTVAPVGPVVPGKGITYQLVQRDPGYFEGKLVITNKTGEPMTDWKITFDAPGANVKNIWGARLVRKGDKVEIQNLENAPAIPPGATWDVQFGAEGPAGDPKNCRLNGKPCGF
jgi:hypothetical protein